MKLIEGESFKFSPQPVLNEARYVLAHLYPHSAIERLCVANGDVNMSKARSINQTAADSGTSRATIYREIKARRLRAKKIGDRTIILPDDFDAWLQSLPDMALAA
jgi:predicted DNA-binding transcriptional regulator AlpA